MPLIGVISRIFAGSIVWMLPVSIFADQGFPAAVLGSLASEDYKERVQAQRDLQAWAEGKPGAAEERLFSEFGAATDPEVRIRLRETLKEVVVLEFQRKQGQGYVGIQMEELNVALPGADEQRGGVLVTWVHPGTPAKEAGLMVNDVVVALNDLKWPAGIGPRESFATEIRRHRPGDKVALEIVRGNEVMKIDLTLGARPMGLDRAMQLFLLPGGDEDPTEEILRLEREAKDAYFERWMAAKRAEGKKP